MLPVPSVILMMKIDMRNLKHHHHHVPIFQDIKSCSGVSDDQAAPGRQFVFQTFLQKASCRMSTEALDELAVARLEHQLQRQQAELTAAKEQLRVRQQEQRKAEEQRLAKVF
jgi:hypothetical protein